MNREDCLLCNGPTGERAAVIAGFVVERCGLNSDRTRIRYCPACDFAFFERRLTATELERLYTDYRGESYNAQRLKHEPGYAPLIPLFADVLSDYYLTRLAEYGAVLALFPEIEPHRVLDFGGDGTLARRLFPAARVEIDDLSAGRASGDHRFDLVFASQVFEHLSEPATALEGLVARLSPQGVVVIDVPIEYQSTLAEGLLLQGARGGPLCVMHEHINHFSAKAVRRLLERAALTPVFEACLPAHRTAFAMACRRGTPLERELSARAGPRRLLWETLATQHRVEAAQADTVTRVERVHAAALNSLREEREALQRQRDIAAAEIEDLGERLADLTVAMEAEHAETARLRAREAALLASRSWHLTAPLRWLGEFLRRR